MNPNIKLNLKNLQAFDFKKIVSLLARFWQRTHTFLFFVFLSIMIILGVYIWQQSLYGGGWSDQQKQDYLAAQAKAVVFDGNSFQKVIDDIQMRQNNAAQNNQQLKDIFVPYK